MTSSAEREVDALYEAPPEAFTKKRDTLIRELRREGETERAAELSRLRKPTRVAYVLNQLARRHPDSVADLVDVGRDLARAQRDALRGRTSEALRDLIDRQRAVVSDVTRQAGELMRELEVDSGLDEVAGALRAALVDPAVGAALEEGRLEKAPAPAAGFPGADVELEVLPPAKPRIEKDRESRQRLKKTREKELRVAQQKAKAKAKHTAAVERRRELLARRDAAEEDARAREDEASAAARIAKERAERVDRLQRELMEAKREAKSAATAARELQARARAARKKAQRLGKR